METEKKHIKQPTLTKEQLSCVQNTLSVGIMLACSSEILCRTAADSLANSGYILRGEAKQALTGLFEGIRKVSHYQQRLLETLLSGAEGEDTAKIFDNLLFNACKMAQIAMCYYNIYADDAQPANKDIATLYNLISNYSLRSTHQAFTQEFISHYEPKV